MFYGRRFVIALLTVLALLMAQNPIALATAIDANVVNARAFGAKGDGITDDRKAIQAAINHAAASGGGTVYFHPGTYLLASHSTDVNSYTSFLTPKNGVNLLGAGSGNTIIKVAAGTNARWAETTVIATRQMLKNCIFKHFTIDWNGANNRLTSSSTKRSNASFMALLGGYNILIDNIIIKNVPGNQCIFFPNISKIDSGQGYITVSNCRFENVGSGLLGNYNQDHSSIYLNGKHNKIFRNKFVSPSKVRGTAFEIHGSYSEAYENYTENYENAFYLATDYESITDIAVHHNTFKNCRNGNVWSGTVYPIGKIEIHNNWFYFVPGSTYPYANEAPKAVCEELNIHHNHYIGQYIGRDFRGMQVNLIKNFIFTNNVMEKFSGRALTFGGTDIGGGYIHRKVIINYNTFNNIVESTAFSTNVIFPSSSSKKVGYFEFVGNKFYRNSPLVASTLVLNVNVDSGIVKENTAVNYINGIKISTIANKVTSL